MCPTDAVTRYFQFEDVELRISFDFKKIKKKSKFSLRVTFLREEILLGEGGWMEGCPVAAGEWRLRAVAASPWVLPNSWGRAS